MLGFEVNWNQLLHRCGVERFRPGLVDGEQVRAELLSMLDQRADIDGTPEEREETAIWRRRVQEAPEHQLWGWLVMWPAQRDKNESYAQWFRANPPVAERIEWRKAGERSIGCGVL